MACAEKKQKTNCKAKMPSPILYSTNPWIAHEFATKYLAGTHFAWCSEYFDPASAAAGSAAAAIAPSSSPKGLYEQLKRDCDAEEGHSDTLKRYKKTFKRLASLWFSAGTISESDRDEIVAVVNKPAWRIWRPVLYVIPRAPIESAGRLENVTRADRAAYGAEWQIKDLKTEEFDIIEVHLK